ncbi:alpha-2-macroglobulin family protein [Chitinophagaceae bacterium MMS25-I14]
MLTFAFTRHIRLFLLFLVFLPGAVFAQRNVFRFPEKPDLLQRSPYTCLYRIPQDSVFSQAYSNSTILPGTPWMQIPAYIIPYNSTDSFLHTPGIRPGYYVSVQAEMNRMNTRIVHKERFHVFVHDLEKGWLITVYDMNGQPNKTAAVTCGKIAIPYSEALQGYLLASFRNNDWVTVKYEDDIVFLQCNSRHNTYKPETGNRELNEKSEIHEYNGYLVTNKPKYLPGDTVKFKAYLQFPRYGNPATEPVAISFRDNYYYGREYVMFPHFEPEEPGVYYGEFVLGDSIKTDRTYTLTVSGKNTGYSLQQVFSVEDYLLDQTKLQVSGEQLPFYQPGDTVQLYAAAYTSNNLPVLDGTIDITLLSGSYNTQQHHRIFIPDTLYHATIPVNPDGETFIGFPTGNFPASDMNMKCLVSLHNSNFEQHDTSFVIQYKTTSAYLSVTSGNETIQATLIRNKKSVSGSGLFWRNNDTATRRAISFPFTYHALPSDASVSFSIMPKKDTTPSIYSSDVAADALQSTDDYVADTAYLYLSNPQKSIFRYSIFAGSRFKGYGIATGDTIIKVHTVKSRTVTIAGSYLWRGAVVNLRFEIYKMSRSLQIDLHKKDLIFPGQSDTITINLSNKDREAITHTNVTVLAYTSQFAEDHVPELPYSGMLKPAYTSQLIKAISQLNIRSLYAAPDKPWLHACGADTVFFYKNLFLLPDDVAWLTFPLPESVMPQLAVYLKSGNGYYQPEIIYVDNRPAYYHNANSTNPQGLFIPEGIHNITLRTANASYYIDTLELCAGEKTNLFLNIDSVGPFMFSQKKKHQPEVKIISDNHLATFVKKTTMPDSLTGGERYGLARCMLLYRNEYPQLSDIRMVQFPVEIYPSVGNNGYIQRNRYGYRENDYVSLAGPFNCDDSIQFFQYKNTALHFMPELNYIFSFRPGMTRVEKQLTEDFLHHRLQFNSWWPDYNYVTPNPDSTDTLHVQPPVADIRYDDQNRTTVQHLIIPREPSAEGNAALIMPRFTDSTIKYLALHEKNDTTQLLIRRWYQGEMLRVKAGVYNAQLIWNNDSCSTIDSILVRPYGATIVPVYYGTAMKPFDYTHPPQWIRKNIIKDTDRVQRLLVPVGTNELYGTVLDAQRQPAINAVITTEQSGIIKGAAVTDIDGNYSIRPLAGGKYNVKVVYTGHNIVYMNGVEITNGHATRVNFNLEASNNTLHEVVIKYVRPLVVIEKPGGDKHLVREQISRMPTRNTNDFAAQSIGAYQQKSGGYISLGGARASGSQYIIDGVMVNGSAGLNTWGVAEDKELPRGKHYLQSASTTNFINSFLNNMMQSSGMRKNFRDWAIWEPDLWTDKYGNTSFYVTYPDNTTSWKTFVLAMNSKGYAAKITSLTRAFKPLSAELSVPRFLRYGDTVTAIGKIANYTGQPFDLTARFFRDTTVAFSDTMQVHHSRVKELAIAAPSKNAVDTAMFTLGFSMQAQNGFTDGEQRTLPVFPVGTINTSGIFACLNGDTSITSRPDTSQGHFTGSVRVHIDASLLESMLHEIEHLKVDPHGCTEQLTTKLQAIYYEEVIKKALKDEKLNNTVVKKKILDQLIKAQNPDGSFGWWSYNATDYRITNYVVSTLYKINKDGWLDYIVKQGLRNLANNISHMGLHDQLASLGTLSAAGFPIGYKKTLADIDKKKLGQYDRFAIIKIKQEQGLPYRQDLDTLMAEAKHNQFGIFWQGHNTYDWYRDDIATALLAYQVVKNDSLYRSRKEEIVNYLLFRKQSGYYGSTASSGLVLSTLLPDLLQTISSGDRKTPTRVVLSGSINDSISAFPKTYELRKNMLPEINIRKKGISPVYVSVSYDYLDLQAKPHDSVFTVNTFLINGKDTFTTLKQGQKVTLHVTVNCRKVTDYVMIEVPIPAGCVPVTANNYYPRWPEAARETFKDRVDIFCNSLNEKTYTFDVPLEVRYKGSYIMNPARACMMYYPEEYGNNAVQRVPIH